MNVILIGFKASGKSTVGKALARVTNRKFIDCDDLTERLYREMHGKQLSCREIYHACGEEVMRHLEAEALRQLPAMTDMVIATGGGVVLRPENVSLLRKAGFCVFLDTPLSVLEQRLLAHTGSPLFRDRSIAVLHTERRPLYMAAAHTRLDVAPDAAPETLARSLMELIRPAG